jgi:hypothetical protein
MCRGYSSPYDFDALCRDLSISVRDLLRENRGIDLANSTKGNTP